MQSTIGENIRELRISNKLTQDELSKRCDISLSALNKYERNERKPKFETMKKITDALGVSINELLGARDLTDEDSEILDFLYEEGLVGLRDVFKEFNFRLSDDEKGNIIITKDKDTVAIVPEKDFIELGNEMLKHIKEFHEFEIHKLLDCYEFLY